MYRHPDIDRDKLTPRQALDILIEGNQRFKNNVLREHDMLRVRDETVDKQHPFASVLSCSDSRTTVELIFDQNLVISLVCDSQVTSHRLKRLVV